MRKVYRIYNPKETFILNENPYIWKDCKVPSEKIVKLATGEYRGVESNTFYTKVSGTLNWKKKQYL